MNVWLRLSAARSLFWIARLWFLVSQSSDRRFVLIGEKEGMQARDNAYHLFRHLYESGRRDVFFVTKRRNVDFRLLTEFGDNVVIYNSLRHYYILLRSRVLILNDGYSDACPRLPGILSTTHEPFYYLRHGILRYKKIFYSSGHYNGRILRFGASTGAEIDIVRNRMMPRSVERELANLQAYLYLMESDIDVFDLRNFPNIAGRFRGVASRPCAPKAVVGWMNRNTGLLPQLGDQIGFPTARIAPCGLPRHDRLLAKMNAGIDDRKMIVLFLTWRDYWRQSGSDEELRLQPFYQVVREIVEDGRLVSFLEDHDLTLGIYIHQKMSAYRSVLSDGLHPRVLLIDDTTDFADMIVRSAALITDYSSVSLDFCLAGKPVFFYQFDQERYKDGRGDYTDEQNEWVGDVSTDPDGLIKAICSLFDPSHVARAEAHSRVLRSDYPELGRSCEATVQAIDTLPPRVTFICYNIFGIGGTVRSVTNFANYLFEKGYHVEILSLKRTSKIPSLGLHPSIRVTSIFDATNRQRSLRRYMEKLLLRVPSLLFNRNEDQYKNVSLRTDLSLIWFLRNCTSDVLIPTIPSLAKAAVKHSRRRTKVLIQEHKFFAAHHPSIRRMIERIYPRADGILSMTDDDAEEYGSISGVPTYVVPNGVRVRGDIEIENHDIRRVVALGRLDQQKQFDLLIRAFQKVAGDFPQWRLFIYGAGGEQANLKNLITELELDGKVFLKGSTKDSGAAIDQADICAVSSSYEGFGMVYIEAYASGKPVVSFDIEKGPKEIMIDGETGLKARPFDIDDYAAKLATLMASEHLRRTMGENGRKFLMRTYEISKVGHELEKAIMATAGNVPHVPCSPPEAVATTPPRARSSRSSAPRGATETAASS